ncbi:DUF1304 domain-containing protein [Roseateles sp.]|uniref:DUF1304 domain-containing protein n=1 Tax=Roseateles sp. TaxID=1971397 RepID=UPI0039EA0123
MNYWDRTLGLLHAYILILEMFLWTKPAGLKAFGLKPEFAQATKALAANQGLYNGFLAAGLFCSLLQGSAGRPTALFFAGCVTVAGVYGALTSNCKILFVQGMPGALTPALVLLAG